MESPGSPSFSTDVALRRASTRQAAEKVRHRTSTAAASVERGSWAAHEDFDGEKRRPSSSDTGEVEATRFSRGPDSLFSEDASDKATMAVYMAMLDLLEHHTNPEACGVSERQLRQSDHHRSLDQVRRLCHVGKLKSLYEQMQESGKFCSGVDEAARLAGKAKQSKEVGEVARVNMSRRELLTPPWKDVEELGSGYMRKCPVLREALEELWKANPGDKAVRRMPEEHEVVFDFEGFRVSMPRFFGDDHHEGDRDVEAGQHQELDHDLTNDGKEGLVTITTMPPRRVHVTDTRALAEMESTHCGHGQQRRRNSLTIEEMDERMADQELKRTARGEEEDPGYSNVASIHMRLTRMPPSEKGWMEWREYQARKRQLEAESRDPNSRRRQRANTGNAEGMLEECSESEEEEPSDEEEDKDSELEAMLGLGSSRTSGRTLPTSRSQPSSRSMKSARSPMSGRFSPGSMGSRSVRRGIDVAGLRDNLPWDARPPPSWEDTWRLADKFLGAGDSKARLQRASRKANVQRSPSVPADPNQPLLWTLRAEGLELQFTTDAVGHSAALLGDEDEESDFEDSEDEKFWRDVFEPAKRQAGLQEACLTACSW